MVIPNEPERSDGDPGNLFKREFYREPPFAAERDSIAPCL